MGMIFLLLRKGVRIRKGAGRPQKKAEEKADYKRAPIVLETKKEIIKMSALVNKCVLKGLEYAYSVLNNNEQVSVERMNKYHKMEKTTQDRYTPEHKIKLLEIFIDKVFTNRKEPVGEIDLGDGPRVVSFNFVPIGKDKCKM